MANSRVKESAATGKGGNKGGGKGTIYGTEGADTLVGTDGNDIIDGRGGSDVLRGGGGSDYLIGGVGDDVLDGGAGADQMDGGAGNDTYVVNDAADFVIERVDGGSDTVLSSVSYALSMDLEHLTLQGAAASNGTGNYRDNQISGNEAANMLNGREGNDVLDGKGGSDVLIGGLGADVFAFTTVANGANVDQIGDFQAGTDRIALDDGAFAGLAPGALSSEAFRVAGASVDADDRVLYDRTSGALLFDADGAGGAEAVMVAMLQPGLDLTFSDFLVI